MTEQRRTRLAGKWLSVLCAGLVALLLQVGIFATAQATPMTVAVLQGLDKVTARISTFRAMVGVPVTFGALTIVVKHCDLAPPEETPEAAAYLEITENHGAGADPLPVFFGWMFASSPALSAMEHPVYDIWVVDCAGKPR